MLKNHQHLGYVKDNILPRSKEAQSICFGSSRRILPSLSTAAQSKRVLRLVDAAAGHIGSINREMLSYWTSSIVT